MNSTVVSKVVLCRHQWSLVLCYVQYSGVCVVLRRHQWNQGLCYVQYSDVECCAMYTSVESSVELCTVQWCLVFCYVHISRV